MTALRRLAWWLQRHGASVALWLGLACTVAAVALDRLAVQPLARQVQQLETAAAARPELKPVALDPAATGALQQLRQFHAYFQRAEPPTEVLRRLSELARLRGLSIRRGDYVLNTGSGEFPMNRYQVVLPLRGTYPVIRGFIMAALRELPTLALDQVQLQRKEVGDTELDAQLSFTIHHANPTTAPR